MVKVSVIIPTYGIPVFLKQSIISVVNQTLNDLELIIVDDNNPNTQARIETERIVSKFTEKDKRIIYIQHERNMNGAAARNTGFAVAVGKYIALLDSDDIYMPDRLQKCYDVMEKSDNSFAGVYTGCEFRCSGKTYKKYINVKDGNYLVETLACRFMFCTGSNIFIRKCVVDELQGFDTSFLRHQDYEFLVRVFEKYSLRAIPELLVIKNNENFNLPNIEKQIEIKNQYLAKYKYIIDRLSRKDADRIMHGNYINIAENALYQKNYRVANQFYSKAREFYELSFVEWFKRLIYLIYNQLKK